MAKNLRDQQRVQSPAAVFSENLEVKKMNVLRPKFKIMRFDGAALQGPAVSGEFALKPDQPQ